MAVILKRHKDYDLRAIFVLIFILVAKHKNIPDGIFGKLCRWNLTPHCLSKLKVCAIFMTK